MNMENSKEQLQNHQYNNMVGQASPGQKGRNFASGRQDPVRSDAQKETRGPGMQQNIGRSDPNTNLNLQHVGQAPTSPNTPGRADNQQSNRNRSGQYSNGVSSNTQKSQSSQPIFHKGKADGPYSPAPDAYERDILAIQEIPQKSSLVSNDSQAKKRDGKKKQVQFLGQEQVDDNGPRPSDPSPYQQQSVTKGINPLDAERPASQFSEMYQDNQMPQASDNQYGDPTSQRTSGSAGGAPRLEKSAEKTSQSMSAFDDLPASESSRLIPIPLLKAENAEVKQQNAIEYYFDQCRIYAQQNLQQTDVHIQKYRIKYKDIDDGVFDDVTKQIGISIEELQENYDSQDIIILKDIIFIQGKQQIVVKTWEKIVNKQEKETCFLKTLRLYDHHNQPVASILTEQVKGAFDPTQVYETSFLKYKESIYYFKRTYCDPEDPGEGASESGGGGAGGGEAPLTGTAAWECANKMDKIVYLQLYKFNFLEKKESKVVGYHLMYQDIPYGLNLLFSQQFGSDKESEYGSELEFLDSQYFVLQSYLIAQEDTTEVLFYAMRDLNHPIHPLPHPSPHAERDASDSKAIQFLNHHEPEKDGNGGDPGIVFITISPNSHCHYQFARPQNQKDKEAELKFVGRQLYKNQNLLQKIWIPKLQIQKLELTFVDSSDQENTIQQYFFVDSRNQVQLLYPNYEYKSEKFQIIDLICSKGGITIRDYKFNKKINCVTESAGCTCCVEENVMQQISHLKKILDNDSIDEQHILTYCNDKIDQILYITQSKEPKVKVIFMKDHHCEDCFHAVQVRGVSQLQDVLKQKMPRGMARAAGTFQKSEQNTKIKGQGEQTRLKQKENYLSKKIPHKYDNFCQEESNEDDEDQINIDIETQLVVVLKNKDDVDESFKCSKAHGEKSKKDSTPKKHFFPHFAFEYRRDTEHSQKQQEEVQACYVDRDESQIGEIACQFVSKNHDHWVFIIKVVTYIDSIKQQSFILVRKTTDELNDIIADFKDQSLHESKRRCLIGNEDTIKLFISDEEFTDGQEDGRKKDGEEDAGKKTVSLKDINITQIKDIHQENQQKKRSTKKLIFEKYVDFECFDLEYVPMIYQECGNYNKNRLIFYDIRKDDVIFIQSINPNQRNRKYLYQDDQGFYPFKICRSSDIKMEEKVQKNMFQQQQRTEKIQTMMLQIFTLYDEKLGRLEQQEFLVQYTYGHDNPIYLRHVGQKNLFMSKKCMEGSDWTQLMNSQAVPFFNERNNTIGSQLILKINKDTKRYINLIDEIKHNNMFTYGSRIVTVGQKKMQLHDEDAEDFIYIISAKLRREVQDQFTMQESYSMLRSVQENIVEMRRPDLRYLLMNTFDSLKEKHFFVLQEVLKGRSICDICLSDTKTIKEALRIYQPDSIRIENTIIHEFSAEDRMRLEAMKDIGFYPKNLIINHDFNFIGTIFRGIEIKAKKSVRLLIHHLQEAINTPDYYHLLMLDLHEILETKEMSLNDFFNNMKKEEHDEDDDEVNDDGTALAQSFLNIEIPLDNESLPQLEEWDKVFTNVGWISTMHELDEELVDAVNSNFKALREQKPSLYQRCMNGIFSPFADEEEKEKHEIEHSYIDFKFLIVGEKIKHMQEESPEQQKFGDLYFAGVMLTQESNLEFFEQPTVMKFIDYQFIRAEKFHKSLFWLYILTFQCPYIITLVSDNKTVHRWVFNVCLPAQLFLLGIELIQLKEQKLEYFQGWNIIDISQILLFACLWVIIVCMGKSDDYDYTPFLKIGMIVLSFIKLIHFVSVFEGIGFFITMLQKCTEDLYPFLFSYLLFCCFFAVLYATMKVEIDDELERAHGLGPFGTLFLVVWRNSVGKLGFARYATLYTNAGQTIGGRFAIGIIWLIYATQIIFQLVVMLNFMIAIIDQTYKKVTDQKKMIIYQNKAEANYEYYQIINQFKNEKEYRVLVFSTCKDYEIEQDKKLEVDDDKWEVFTDSIMKAYRMNKDKYVAQCKNIMEQLDSNLEAQRQLEIKLDRSCQKYAEKIAELKQKVKNRDCKLLGIPPDENQKIRFQIQNNAKIKLGRSRRMAGQEGTGQARAGPEGGVAGNQNQYQRYTMDPQRNDYTFRNQQNQP